MYQVVIRILGPQLPVFDFSLGKIVDGQFCADDVSLLPACVLQEICISELLGTQAYIHSGRLSAITSALLDAGAIMQFYPNFIVFTLPENYVAKKEKDA